MKPFSEFDEDDFLAPVRAEAMEHTADYLQRGRHLESAAFEPLKDLWVSVFRAWATSRQAANATAMRDTQAELGLRGTEPPYGLVRTETRKLSQELLVEGPARDNLRAKIAAFLKRLDDDPSN